MAVITVEPAFRTWDQLSELEQMQSLYSDYHKEAYGYRPRGDVSHWTVEDFRQEFEILGRTCEANEQERNESETRAAERFEALVTKLVTVNGAKDREQAIRWLADAEGVGDDMEYLCCCLGLKYGYFNK